MRNYYLLTSLLSPILPLWLYWRQMIGKEDAKRISERFGKASIARPAGSLLWLHAASVGEANSVLLLIEKIRARFPDLQLLLTTGTVTSAQLMQKRLPKGVIHQYVPIDTPQATQAFIKYWKPDFAFWVESEFWPNLIMAANASQCFMGVINARMSERSFISWQKRPAMIKTLLSCFDVVCAQSGDDAERLTILGAHNVKSLGNLKYDAALLPCDEAELVRLKKTIGDRPIWLAASTHPGEEAQIAEVHHLLSISYPKLLTVIVPRHPERGKDIVNSLKSLPVALRSGKETITADTAIYIADTLGELGLFYRLCETVFMGGSLVAHGGQNPLEPARLACAILTGPHTHNFAAIYQDMEKNRCCLRVANVKSLASELHALLGNPAAAEQMQQRAKQWVEAGGGAADRILSLLTPVFSLRRRA